MTRSEQRSKAEALALRSQLERLSASFDELSDARGQLRVDEFQRALDLRSAFVARHLFRLFDLDGNGVIEPEEFVTAVERLVLGSREEKLEFLFRFHDQDSDGSIDHLELDRLIHLGLAESEVELPEAVVDEMIAALFEAADENRDGRISFEEFSDVFGEHPRLLARVTRADSVWRALRGGGADSGRTDLKLPLVRRLSYWLEGHGVESVWLLIYALVNLGLFVEAGLRYRADGATLLVQLARGSGACLNFNCALILVAMLRYSLSWLRASRIGRLLPVDHSVTFHKLVGHVIVGFGVVHTVAHLANYLDVHASISPGLFGTEAGLTGFVLLIVLGLMWVFALEPIRRTGHFELFHSVHLLYWLLFAVLLAHGPHYWMWLVAPMLGYVVERVLRATMRSNKVELHTQVLPSRVTKLSFNAPPGWRHRAGDYLFLRIPAIAKYEWHPFTISSAPERIGAMPPQRVSAVVSKPENPEAATLRSLAPPLYRQRPSDELTLHVRSLGNWTSALHELARNRAGLDWPARLEARIDGPYGTPSGDIFATKYAVLVGGGIGVTPFAAILDSILRRSRAGDGASQLEKVHFVWVNRDQYAFEWFTELLAQLEAEDREGLLDIHIYMTRGRAQLDAAALELAREVFYAKTRRDVLTGLSARTNFGRPDWEQLLTTIVREHAPERVELFMCGPLGMSKALRPLCRELGIGFHHEVF